MKNNMVKTLALAAITTLSLSAQADEGSGYIGFGFGNASNDACENQPAGTSCEDSKTVGRIVGGYEFNQNFAIEGAYTSLGEAELKALSGPARASIDGSAFSVSFIGTAPLGENWALYGKLGYSRWDAEASITDASGDTLKGDDDGNDPVYGAGIKWFDGDYSLRLEYERYEVGLSDSTDGFFDDQDVDIISLSYVISF